MISVYEYARHDNSVIFVYLYSVSIYGAGFAYVEEVFCDATFLRYIGSLDANYVDKCHKDTMWCVGIGGCFIPHMLCWAGRRLCVEDATRTLHICMFLIIRF